jgi:hypothetical protein
MKLNLHKKEFFGYINLNNSLRIHSIIEKNDELFNIYNYDSKHIYTKWIKVVVNDFFFEKKKLNEEKHMLTDFLTQEFNEKKF